MIYFPTDRDHIFHKYTTVSQQTINSCSRLSAPQIKGKLSKGVTNRSVHSAIYLCNGLLKHNKLVNIMKGSLEESSGGIFFCFLFFLCVKQNTKLRHASIFIKINNCNWVCSLTFSPHLHQHTCRVSVRRLPATLSTKYPLL